jgi:hypothetical protein
MKSEPRINAQTFKTIRKIVNRSYRAPPGVLASRKANARYLQGTSWCRPVVPIRIVLARTSRSQQRGCFRRSYHFVGLVSTVVRVCRQCVVMMMMMCYVCAVSVWMSKALNVNSFILEANQTTWSNPGFCCLVQSGKYMLESQVKNVQAPR